MGIAFINLFIPLIFWVFFIWVIVKSIKSRNAKSGQNQNPQGGYGQAENYRQQRNVRASVNNRNANRAGKTTAQSHNHAYEHKVQPIKEATVMQQHYERQAEQQKKREERDAMYSQGTGSTRGYDTSKAKVGKNGDYGDVPNQNERLAVCRYCGAKNILPNNVKQMYTCYFCRQEI